MRLVRLIEAGTSGTPLGTFLEAVMRGFKPQEMVLAVGRSERNLAYLYKHPNTEARRRGYAVKHFREIRSLAKKSGLRASYMAATSNIESLMETNYVTGGGRGIDLQQHLEQMVGTLRRIVSWEMDGLVYFELAQNKVHYWTDRRPFDPAVYKRFSKSEWDIEQASKCMAVGRYTACVFHLMCAIDLALQRLAKRFKVKVTLSMTWKAIIEKLQKKIDQKYPQKPPSGSPPLTTKQKLRRARYQEILLLLDRIREAWRNDTMHSRYHYDEQEAEEVFVSVRAFMLRVAKVI